MACHLLGTKPLSESNAELPTKALKNLLRGRGGISVKNMHLIGDGMCAMNFKKSENAHK